MGFTYLVSGGFQTGIDTEIQQKGTTFIQANSSQDWIGTASTITQTSGTFQRGQKLLLRIDPTDNRQLDVDLYEFICKFGKKEYNKIYLDKEIHHPKPRIDENGSTIFDINLPSFMVRGTAIIMPKNSSSLAGLGIPRVEF